MLQKIIKSAQLLSLPDIYFQLRELIDDPGYTMAEVALLVGRDPGMATRFLQVANSPLNRRVHKIETISHAVSLLGIRQVNDIVLSASVLNAFEGMQNEVMDMKIFWRQSFYCAVTTQRLALECKTLESDRLFTISLLHNIGHLFMYLSIPKEAQEAILKAKELERPLYQVEREMLGFDFAKLGALVMGQWDLPQIFQDVIHFHPEPSKVNQFAMETALLHLSTLLVMSDLEEGVFGQGAYTVDPMVLTKTNLTMETCLNIRQKASDQFTEVENSLLL